ncbi:hypothetical protein QAD02_013437 [Eretmocerus hayati]|uniref:Uncharacterized protein n=1 Tax=Eretmocerus hayati TaxID=131215 RepID=A0ACC2P240_9HYME|nr:hypothetical protein QAD02_013437 [Eretmocerus hayati]
MKVRNEDLTYSGMIPPENAYMSVSERVMRCRWQTQQAIMDMIIFSTIPHTIRSNPCHRYYLPLLWMQSEFGEWLTFRVTFFEKGHRFMDLGTFFAPNFLYITLPESTSSHRDIILKDRSHSNPSPRSCVQGSQGRILREPPPGSNVSDGDGDDNGASVSRPIVPDSLTQISVTPVENVPLASDSSDMKVSSESEDELVPQNVIDKASIHCNEYVDHAGPSCPAQGDMSDTSSDESSNCFYDTSSQDTSDSDVEETKCGAKDSSAPFGEQLLFWALKNKVRHTMLTELLKILQPRFPELPKTAKTFLHNKPSPQYQIKKFMPGDESDKSEFVYFEIEEHFKKIVNPNLHLHSMIIFLMFFIDGLPLFKSSPISFWPILGKVIYMMATINMHDLLHMPDDVEEMGCDITQYTAFPFENNLGVTLKGGLRSDNKPLAQICQRTAEQDLSIERPEVPATHRILKIAKRRERRVITKLKCRGFEMSSSYPKNIGLLDNGDFMRITEIYQEEGGDVNKIYSKGTIFVKKAPALLIHQNALRDESGNNLVIVPDLWINYGEGEENDDFWIVGYINTNDSAIRGFVENPLPAAPAGWPEHKCYPQAMAKSYNGAILILQSLKEADEILSQKKPRAMRGRKKLSYYQTELASGKATDMNTYEVSLESFPNMNVYVQDEHEQLTENNDHSL